MDSQTSLNLSVETDKELQEYGQSNVPNESNDHGNEIDMQSLAAKIDYFNKITSTQSLAAKTDGTLKKAASTEEIDENDKNIESSKYDENVDERIYNKRALSSTAETYELETFEKKIMYIFNQVYIDGCDREGIDKDVKALKETFQNFGFNIMEKKDRTKAEILSDLDELGEVSNLDDYGCIAVVVLTWMHPDGTLLSKDEPYTERDIIKCLRVNKIPTLVTKPKIIIIQACKYEKMVPCSFVPEIIYTDNDEQVYYTLPAESDMLIVHSSYFGKSTSRPLNGSWFIQTLCNYIKFYAHTDDLESILVRLKRAVAIDIEENEQERLETNNKMPVITSTLIRKLELKKYLGIVQDSTPTNLRDVFVERPRSRKSKKQETETDAGPSQDMDSGPSTEDQLSN